MRIYYNSDDGLVIQTQSGNVRIYYNTDDGLVIENEELLKEVDLSTRDALLMYFSRTGSGARERYKDFIEAYK